MTEDFLNAPGRSIQHDFKGRKPRALVQALTSGILPFAALVECREDESLETVVVDVEVQLPRRKRADIRRIERIAIAFDRDDKALPDFLALRPDFPHVAHQNLTSATLRSLCLFDEDYADLKPRWTPMFAINRLRDWLRHTAKGTLHGDDQPLEPFLQEARETIVLPQTVFEGSADSGAHLDIVAVHEDPFVLVADPERTLRGPKPQGPSPGMIATAIKCPPRPHGIMHEAPKKLADLDSLVSDEKFDLIAVLRNRIQNWNLQATGGQKENLRLARLLLIIWLPKTRTSDGVVEETDVRGYLSRNTILELGRDVGAWEVVDGIPGTVVGGDSDAHGTGSETEIAPIRVCFTLTRERAAWLNDLPHQPNLTVAAVGVGALGSQVVANVMRTGFGEWTVIDEDVLLPHNVARHLLPGAGVGQSKAEMLASWVNTSLPEEANSEWICSNLLRPRQEDESRVRDCLTRSDLVLDISASLAVSRTLAFDANSSARRVSMFLGPSGSALVVLAEGTDRKVRLDMLDAQFHRALLEDNDLRCHFRTDGQRVRYGQTCRDVTAQLPHDLVALHAAIAARTVLELPTNPDCRISVWVAHADRSVERRDIPVSQTMTSTITDWTVIVDRETADHLRGLRRERLSNETGGVLMGRLDLERRIIYLLKALRSPRDSRETRSSYLRGTRGLPAAIRRIETLSDGVVHYLGEWHSHPEQSDTAPSDDDRKLFSWLTSRMRPAGVPAIMAIAGDEDLRIIVDDLDGQAILPWPSD